jgi:hypothetical protein
MNKRRAAAQTFVQMSAERYIRYSLINALMTASLVTKVQSLKQTSRYLMKMKRINR